MESDFTDSDEFCDGFGSSAATTPTLYAFDCNNNSNDRTPDRRCHSSGPIHRGLLFILSTENWNGFHVVLAKSFLRCYSSSETDRSPAFCYDLHRSKSRLVPPPPTDDALFVTNIIAIDLRNGQTLFVQVPRVSALLYWLSAFTKAASFDSDRRKTKNKKNQMKIIHRFRQQLNHSGRKRIRRLLAAAADRICCFGRSHHRQQRRTTPTTLMRGYLDVSTDLNNYYRRYLLVDATGTMHVFRKKKDTRRSSRLLLSLPLDTLILHLPTDHLEHIFLHLVDKLSLKPVLSLKGNDIFSMGRVLEVLIRFVDISARNREAKTNAELTTATAAIITPNNPPTYSSLKKSLEPAANECRQQDKLLIELKLAIGTRDLVVGAASNQTIKKRIFGVQNQ